MKQLFLGLIMKGKEIMMLYRNAECYMGTKCTRVLRLTIVPVAERRRSHAINFEKLRNLFVLNGALA